MNLSPVMEVVRDDALAVVAAADSKVRTALADERKSVAMDLRTVRDED